MLIPLHSTVGLGAHRRAQGGAAPGGRLCFGSESWLPNRHANRKGNAGTLNHSGGRADHQEDKGNSTPLARRPEHGSQVALSDPLYFVYVQNKP